MVLINNIEIEIPESCLECDIAKIGYYFDDNLVYCPLVAAFFTKDSVGDKRHLVCPLKEG